MYFKLEIESNKIFNIEEFSNIFSYFTKLEVLELNLAKNCIN